MKKLITITLCFVLTAAALTACRSKAPEETNSPTHSSTTPATTDATIPATMPTILPETTPSDGTGDTNATNGTDSDMQRQGGNPMAAR